MKVINVLQGSNEWLSVRASHDTASEAPIALGESKFSSRNELMDQKKTGLVKEVNSFTQKLFDRGHATEKMALPFAEKIIDDELSPITASLEIDGLKLLASFDGINFDSSIIFEHKLWSEGLAADVRSDNLKPHYTIQLDQQLLVSGADKALFMTSDGTEENMAYCWYFPSQDKFNALIAGWKQFNLDLDTHVPVVAVAEPTAQPIVSLPALFIHATGEITTSNMKEYGEALAKRLVEVRAIALVTDQDFADAKSAAKHLRDGIVQARAAKEAMLSQTVTVGEAARMIDTWCEDMRLTALKLENDVKDQDFIKKGAMIQAAQDSFTKLIAVLEKDTAPIRLNIATPNFAEAIKGKSKYDSMQDAISTLVANSTIAANQVAMDIRDKQRLMAEFNGGYSFLFADLQQIIFKPLDDFKLLVSSRIDAHIKLTAEREQKIKDDAAAAALAKKAAEDELARKAVEASRIAQEAVKVSNETVAEIPTIFATVKVTQEEFKEIYQAEQEPLGMLDMASGVGRLGAGYAFKHIPSAEQLVQDIAQQYDVTLELALEWLRTWDFNKVTVNKAA